MKKNTQIITIKNLEKKYFNFLFSHKKLEIFNLLSTSHIKYLHCESKDEYYYCLNHNVYNFIKNLLPLDNKKNYHFFSINPIQQIELENIFNLKTNDHYGCLTFLRNKERPSLDNKIKEHKNIYFINKVNTMYFKKLIRHWKRDFEDIHIENLGKKEILFNRNLMLNDFLNGNNLFAFYREKFAGYLNYLSMKKIGFDCPGVAISSIWVNQEVSKNIRRIILGRFFKTLDNLNVSIGCSVHCFNKKSIKLFLTNNFNIYAVKFKYKNK